MFKAFRQFRMRRRLALAIRSGDRDEAVAAALAFAGEFPNDFRIQNDIGVELLDLGSPENAERCFRRAVDLKEHEIHWNNLGRALAAQKRIGDARSAYRHAANLNPTDPQPRYNQLSLLFDEGKPDEVANALWEFVAEFPNHSNGQYSLGGMLQSQGKTDAALAAFLRAVELSPKNVAACF